VKKEKGTSKAPDSVSKPVRDIDVYHEKLVRMSRELEDRIIGEFAREHNLGTRKKRHVAALECPICWKSLGELACGCRFGYDHTMAYKCREHQNMTVEEEKQYWNTYEIVGEYSGLKVIVFNYYPPLIAGTRIDEMSIIFDRRFYDTIVKTGSMELYKEVLQRQQREWEISAELLEKQGMEPSDCNDEQMKTDIGTRARKMAQKLERKGFAKDLQDFCQENISKYYQRENDQVKKIIYTAFNDYLSSDGVLPETKETLAAVLEKEYGKGKTRPSSA